MLKSLKLNEGFTLIELLVVIIIIGILSAIALPSFLNQAQKAKQTEAQQTVSAMNRAQQAYFLEHSNQFSSDISALGIGIKTETVNYSYSITHADGTDATNLGTARVGNLRSYTGCVLRTTTALGEATTISDLIPSELNPSGTSDPATCQAFNEANTR